MNIIVSLIAGFLYYMLVIKIIDELTKNYNTIDAKKNKLLLKIIFGIFAIIIADHVLDKFHLENQIVKNGLVIGGVILFIISSVDMWNVDDSTIMAGVSLFTLFTMVNSFVAS